jgi:hypothetical protein
MELIEVQVVYTLFSTNEYMLVSRVWMDPACSAVDTERTTIEHLMNNMQYSKLALTARVHSVKRDDHMPWLGFPKTSYHLVIKYNYSPWKNKPPCGLLG